MREPRLATPRVQLARVIASLASAQPADCSVLAAMLWPGHVIGAYVTPDGADDSGASRDGALKGAQPAVLEIDEPMVVAISPADAVLRILHIATQSTEQLPLGLAMPGQDMMPEYAGGRRIASRRVHRVESRHARRPLCGAALSLSPLPEVPARDAWLPSARRVCSTGIEAECIEELALPPLASASADDIYLRMQASPPPSSPSLGDRVVLPRLISQDVERDAAEWLSGWATAALSALPHSGGTADAEAAMGPTVQPDARVLEMDEPLTLPIPMAIDQMWTGAQVTGLRTLSALQSASPDHTIGCGGSRNRQG